MKLMLSFLFLVLNGFAQLTQAQVSGLDTLKNLDGSKPEFNTEKPLLIYFWATWCPSCKEHIKKQIPEWAEDKKLNIITVATDTEIDRIQNYIKKEKVKVRVLIDSKNKLSDDLKIFNVPGWAVYKFQEKSWKLVAAEEGSDEEKIFKTLEVK